MVAALSRTSPLSNEVGLIAELVSQNLAEDGLHLPGDKAAILLRRLDLIKRQIATLEHELGVFRASDQEGYESDQLTIRVSPNSSIRLKRSFLFVPPELVLSSFLSANSKAVPIAPSIVLGRISWSSIIAISRTCSAISGGQPSIGSQRRGLGW